MVARASAEIIVGNRPLLVITQTPEVQEEIQGTLELLRKAGGLKTAAQQAAGDDQPPPPPPHGPLHIRRPAPPAGGKGGGARGMGGNGDGMGMGGMGGECSDNA